MPNRCSAVGCKNRSENKLQVSFHCFPKDAAVRAKWISNLNLDPNFVVSNRSRVCSAHFENWQFMHDADYPHVRRHRLRDGAVPKSVGCYEEGVQSFQPHAKTSTAEVNTVEMNTVEVNTVEMNTVEVNTVEMNTVDAAAKGTPNMISRYTQCNSVPYTTRHVATQTCDIQPPQEIVDTGVEMCESLLTSTPIKRKRTKEPSLSELENDSISDGLETSFSQSSDQDSSFQIDHFSDDSFTFDTDIGKTEEEDHTSFLVFKSCLLLLFQYCYMCLSLDSPSVTKCKTLQTDVRGTCVTISTTCENGHLNKWTSQPECNGKALGNIRLAAGLFFSGCEIMKSIRMFSAVGMHCFSASTYHALQRNYFLYATHQVWKRQQQQLLIARQSRPVAVGGDGRCDSMGHCAKYCTYFTMDVESNTVIDVQIVQSTEVKSSVAMEKEALKRSLDFLVQEQINISHLVTDRHTQIRKFMRVKHPDIVHVFDVWHFAKGIRKKLVAAAKTKAFCGIADWIESINHHLYWSVMSSGGNGHLAVEKWSSFSHHVVNIHDGHGELYKKCGHGQIARKWLTKDGPAHQKLNSIVNARTVIKDIGQLSHRWQTSHLECLQKLVIHYAPKHIHYAYMGMHARCLLAALHYNENGNKMHAKTASGTLHYDVTRDKKRSGRTSVRSVKEHSTFNYVSELMQEVLKLCRMYTYNKAPKVNDDGFAADYDPIEDLDYHDEVDSDTTTCSPPHEVDSEDSDTSCDDIK